MTRIHVLGAGTPTPTPTRFGSSFVVEIENDQIMVDCGPAATHKLVKAGLWPTKIDYVLFTHHHFDHDVDFPCFLLTRWDQSIGKENILQIFGPKLTEEFTEGIIGENGLFKHDLIARLNFYGSKQVYVNRGGKLPRKPPEVIAKNIGEGKILSTDKWEVTAATAIHAQPYLDSLAYRIDGPDGSMVFTGDTEPCESVKNLAKNADIMLCMCWDEQTEIEKNNEARGQCGTLDAAKLAQAAKVKRLVLVHVGPNLSQYSENQKALKEIKKVYDGEVIFSNELMTIDL